MSIHHPLVAVPCFQHPKTTHESQEEDILHHISLMWPTQCHKPTTTGDGRHTTHKNGDDLGMVHFKHLQIYLEGWVPKWVHMGGFL